MSYNVTIGVHVRKVSRRRLRLDEEVIPGRDGDGLLRIDDWRYYEKAATFEWLPRAGDAIRFRSVTPRPLAVTYVIHTPIEHRFPVKPTILLRHMDFANETGFELGCQSFEDAGFKLVSTQAEDEEVHL